MRVPSGIHDLELGVLEGDAGVDRADLADQQAAVRRVCEDNGDHALLSAVRQIDRLRGIGDIVAICRVYLIR